MDYSSYLKLNELLSLQQSSSPSSEHRNECLFIIVHQVHELWFKQLINEIHYAIELVGKGAVSDAISVMARINTITQTIVNQMPVINTLTAHEFHRFREYLGSASGFQSYQFDGIEALLGKANSKKLRHYQYDKVIQEKLAAILQPVTLWHAVRQQFIGTANATADDKDILKNILERPSYEALLLNQLLDLDSLLQEWRFRHAKLVERTIGSSTGTGGSAGLSYLKSTLFTPIFVELWAAINRS
ncbi:tryptophan 2,3-dioxygenase family protein [Pseudomonas syringae pv. tagetis]|uniref:Putative dioxygenase n=1 Tax=Pseudomonas syringae pv. tagetis TaxID=129140 RepID=A0A0Q0HDS8_9PSED|nr:tryptophan 2,3-dioxygenase family protein [Pseudomonas syringae group genomosp. 7]KPY86850.1 putative dioxygenase [Pseudomonas syringae pv. tagetis]RMW11956.1 putative dioxygenase [Pseudomonas syringae pv. tagetis]RMW24880.1 putative dioxygenase [Pseudomonas syringae pv. tagetis]UNB66298.1 tryptophan 2,3-dioxygenase family protein [Pseudomonas syringae pv. tagetis]